MCMYLCIWAHFACETRVGLHAGPGSAPMDINACLCLWFWPSGHGSVWPGGPICVSSWHHRHIRICTALAMHLSSAWDLRQGRLWAAAHRMSVEPGLGDSG